MKTNNSGSAFKYPEAIARYGGIVHPLCMDYLFDFDNATEMEIRIMTDGAIDLHDSIICKDGQFKTLAMTSDGAIHVMIRDIYEIPQLMEMEAIVFHYFGGIGKYIVLNQWLNMVINNSNKE
jgi:hypothetical protein